MDILNKPITGHCPPITDPVLPRAQRLTTTAFATAFREGRVLRHPLLHMRACRRATASRLTASSNAAQVHPTLLEACGTSAQSTLCPLATGNLRAAFVVPKKLGPATFRNHLRRRMSEAFSDAQKSTGSDRLFRDFFANYDLIFLATPATSNASFAQIGEAFSQLMRRLGAESTRAGSGASRPGSSSVGSVPNGSVSRRLRGETGRRPGASLTARDKRHDAGIGTVEASQEVL